MALSSYYGKEFGFSVCDIYYAIIGSMDRGL